MNKKKIFITSLFVLFFLGIIILYSGIFDFNIPNIKDYTGWVPGLIAISALVDSINPCAFSVLFLTITFLFSLNRDRKDIIKAGILYIFGIFITYILIGLGILKVLSLFNVPNIVSKAGAFIIISFGIIALINEFFPNFPIKLKIPKFAYGNIAKIMGKATLPAALLLGFAVGLFEFPCTGGPYLFVLGLLHDQANFLKGFSYLIFYNLIFVLPLVVILLISANKAVYEIMDKIRRSETKKARIWIALIMITLGLLVFMIN